MIYFASFEEYKGRNGVSISSNPPEFYRGPDVRALIPSKASLRKLRKTGDRYAYQSSYLNQLDKVFKSFSGEKILTFLFGKVVLTNSKDFKSSHRYYLYEYLRRKGFEVMVYNAKQ